MTNKERQECGCRWCVRILENDKREHEPEHGVVSELRSTGWLEELEAAIRKLYNVIPRMVELGEDEAWLEDAVHARNQLEMIAREKRSRSSNMGDKQPP